MERKGNKNKILRRIKQRNTDNNFLIINLPFECLDLHFHPFSGTRYVVPRRKKEFVFRKMERIEYASTNFVATFQKLEIQRLADFILFGTHFFHFFICRIPRMFHYRTKARTNAFPSVRATEQSRSRLENRKMSSLREGVREKELCIFQGECIKRALLHFYSFLLYTCVYMKVLEMKERHSFNT